MALTFETVQKVLQYATKVTTDHGDQKKWFGWGYFYGMHIEKRFNALRKKWNEEEAKLVIALAQDFIVSNIGSEYVYAEDVGFNWRLYL